MDTVLLVFRLQMHIAVALNLWGDIVVNMIFWLILKSYPCRTPKLVVASILSYQDMYLVFQV